jgi:hypothetical protein
LAACQLKLGDNLKMNFDFREKSEAKRVPETIQEYLKKRFKLRTSYLGDLMCFEHECISREKQIKQIRIFNPTLARKKGLAIKWNSDLEQHPEVLLFEGYTSNHGQIFIMDLGPR